MKRISLLILLLVQPAFAQLTNMQGKTKSQIGGVVSGVTVLNKDFFDNNIFQRLVELNNRFEFDGVDVISYAADSTGATDSQSAFENAIAAAQARNAPVLIPDGTYLIASALSTISTAGKPIMLIGTGHGEVTINYTGSGAMIKVNDRSDTDFVDNNILSGFKWVGPTDSTANFLEMTYARFNLIHNLRVERADTAFVMLDVGNAYSYMSHIRIGASKNGIFIGDGNVWTGAQKWYKVDLVGIGTTSIKVDSAAVGHFDYIIGEGMGSAPIVVNGRADFYSPYISAEAQTLTNDVILVDKGGTLQITDSYNQVSGAGASEISTNPDNLWTGIRVKNSGTVRLHNVALTGNAHGSTGVSSGTQRNGADIVLTDSTCRLITSGDVRIETDLRPKLHNKNPNGTILNYIQNGNLNSLAYIDTGWVDITVLSDENGIGGNELQVSSVGSSNQEFLTFRANCEDMLNRSMVLVVNGWFNATVSNPRIIMTGATYDSVLTVDTYARNNTSGHAEGATLISPIGGQTQDYAGLQAYVVTITDENPTFKVVLKNSGASTAGQYTADIGFIALVPLGMEDEVLLRRHIFKTPTILSTQDSTTTFDGGLVVNENAYDKDWRFEGSSEANLFYGDAGNNRVGIGAVPTSLFDVFGGALFVRDANATIKVSPNYGGANKPAVVVSTSDPFYIGTNNLTAIRIDPTANYITVGADAAPATNTMFDIRGRVAADTVQVENNVPSVPQEGDMWYIQGASAAEDTLVIYINSKEQKFVGTVTNP